MGCQHCTDGPGQFALSMFASHIIGQVHIEDYDIDLQDEETRSEVWRLLRDYLEPAMQVCMWDLLLDSVTVKEGYVPSQLRGGEGAVEVDD